MRFVPESIEAYVEQHCTPESPLLQGLAQDTRATQARANMQTGHVEGSLLRMLARMSGARRVLEIGTFTGYSALCLAEGLPDDGQVITCDVDEAVVARARAFWNRSPHGHKIESRIGPALDTLAKLDGPLDLVFIDADKENYLAYWEAALGKLKPGGLIVVDNVLWSGKVLAPETPADHAIAALNDAVARDERVEAILLTVRDGVTIARKREKDC